MEYQETQGYQVHEDPRVPVVHQETVDLRDRRVCLVL